MDSGRRTNSAEWLLVSIAVAVLVAGSALDFSAFSTEGITRTTNSTTTVTMNSAQEVMSAFAAHLQSIKSHNATALVAQYEANATLDLVCAPNGLSGVSAGVDNINILYHVMFNATRSGAMNFTDFGPGIFANVKGETIVNSTFNAQGSQYPLINAFSGYVPPEPWNATARLGASYVEVGDAWLISSEIWIFGVINTVYNTCG